MWRTATAGGTDSGQTACLMPKFRCTHAELLGDECLSATFFAPTSQAVARSNWGDWASPGFNITGSLLYHLVPFEVSWRRSHACRSHPSVLTPAQHSATSLECTH